MTAQEARHQDYLAVRQHFIQRLELLGSVAQVMADELRCGALPTHDWEKRLSLRVESCWEALALSIAARP
jgi:hypothetical protein